MLLWYTVRLLGAFTLALGLSLYLTPMIRGGAIAFGVLDRPDGRLKNHAEPVPYLGGIAVYLAFLVTLSLVFEFRAQLLGLLLGATMMTMLGLFDDLKVLSPRLKLAGQLLAAWIMLHSGIEIQLVSLPEAVRIALTILWLVGITNSLNILDVSDGLATGVSAIAALGLFVVAVLNGDALIAVTTLALVGGLLGFLRYNQAPAQIYLGDAGSLFLGFMLAALSMVGAYTRQHEMAVFAPVLILIVPILETTLVVLARAHRGQSPLCGSPDHLAIRLKHHGWSAKQVAAFAYGLGLLGAVAGVAVVLLPAWPAMAVLSLMLVLGTGVLAWLWCLPAPSRAPVATPLFEPGRGAHLHS